MIQGMLQYVFVNSSGNRMEGAVVVCAGQVYWGAPDATPTKPSGSYTLATDRKVKLAYGQGKVYILDTLNPILVLDLEAGSIAALTATAGSLPTNPTVMCIWRDRLVFGGPGASVFCSRLGTHTDFDYGKPDVASAFASTQGMAGRVGDIVLALCAVTDDILLVFCDQSIWRFLGDPAAGGSIDCISHNIGIAGYQAWDYDSSGNIYFASTAGFFRMGTSGQALESLSVGRQDRYFNDVNRFNHWVLVRWDQDRQRALVFHTPMDGGHGEHRFWDARTDSWWPFSYAAAEHSPSEVLTYNGQDTQDRLILLGCQDHIVRKIDRAADSDDGNAILSEIDLGPLRPTGADGESKLTEVRFVLGERTAGFEASTFHMEAELKVGDSAYEALEDPETNYDFTAFDGDLAFQERVRVRRAGNSFFLNVWNDTLDTSWSLEEVAMVFEPAGRQRGREVAA